MRIGRSSFRMRCIDGDADRLEVLATCECGRTDATTTPHDSAATWCESFADHTCSAAKVAPKKKRATRKAIKK